MALNACLGIFFMGFNQGVFSVVQLAVMNLNDTTSEAGQSLFGGLMTSLYPVGGLIGALGGARFLHFIGGVRKSMLYLDLLGIITTAIIIASHNYSNIIIGRFLCGLVAGVNTSVVPYYVKEYSPVEVAGKTGSFN